MGEGMTRDAAIDVVRQIGEARQSQGLQATVRDPRFAAYVQHENVPPVWPDGLT